MQTLLTKVEDSSLLLSTRNKHESSLVAKKFKNRKHKRKRWHMPTTRRTGLHCSEWKREITRMMRQDEISTKNADKMKGHFCHTKRVYHRRDRSVHQTMKLMKERCHQDHYRKMRSKMVKETEVSFYCNKPKVKHFLVNKFDALQYCIDIRYATWRKYKMDDINYYNKNIINSSVNRQANNDNQHDSQALKYMYFFPVEYRHNYEYHALKRLRNDDRLRERMRMKIKQELMQKPRRALSLLQNTQNSVCQHGEFSLEFSVLLANSTCAAAGQKSYSSGLENIVINQVSCKLFETTSEIVADCDENGCQVLTLKKDKKLLYATTFLAHTDEVGGIPFINNFKVVNTDDSESNGMIGFANCIVTQWNDVYSFNVLHKQSMHFLFCLCHEMWLRLRIKMAHDGWSWFNQSHQEPCYFVPVGGVDRGYHGDENLRTPLDETVCKIVNNELDLYIPRDIVNVIMQCLGYTKFERIAVKASFNRFLSTCGGARSSTESDAISEKKARELCPRTEEFSGNIKDLCSTSLASKDGDEDEARLVTYKYYLESCRAILNRNIFKNAIDWRRLSDSSSRCKDLKGNDKDSVLERYKFHKRFEMCQSCDKFKRGCVLYPWPVNVGKVDDQNKWRPWYRVHERTRYLYCECLVDDDSSGSFLGCPGCGNNSLFCSCNDSSSDDSF